MKMIKGGIMSQMIEYLAIVFIGLGVIWGFMSGFVKVFFSWFSVLVGIVVSMNFSYGVASAFFPEYRNNILVIFLIGIILFSLVYIFFSQIARIFASILAKHNLHGLDYILGGIFGGGQVMIVVGLILYWMLKSMNLDLSSTPVAMFSVYWAERIITVLGVHIDIANKLL